MTRTSNHNRIEQYLQWLEPQLRDGHSNLDKTYWGLINAMFEREFVAIIPMDENRMVDGTDLRVTYGYETHRSTSMLKLLPCSFLEVVIALSKRLAFNAGGEAPGWAWQLLENLELTQLSDPFTPNKKKKAEFIMDRVIGRYYSPDGSGGFFPLAWPDEDQTGIEIWYQMHAYIGEIHPEH